MYGIFPSIALRTTSYLSQIWDACSRLFQICTNFPVFLLPFSPLLNLSQMFINAYKLFVVLVNNVYRAH